MYPVLSRGHRRAEIFRCDVDRHQFLNGIWKRLRSRVLLWLLCLLFGWWRLAYLAQERQEERERVLYGGLSVREWVGRAMSENYYCCVWAILEEYQQSDADRRVISIGGPAVPLLVQRLRKSHSPKYRDILITWRQRLLPSWEPQSGMFSIPSDMSGEIAHANYLLSRMGRAAQPAVPAMLDSTRDMHIWAFYDLLADFVHMGDDARGALPKLKAWASEGDEDSAMAVKFIGRGLTNLDYSQIELAP